MSTPSFSADGIATPHAPATLDEQRPSGLHSHKRSLIALGALILGQGFVFFDAWRSMIGQWWASETFTHGFLVGPISLFLIWRQREMLRQIPASPSVIGIALLAICGFGWLLGELADVNAVRQIAAVAALPASVLAVFGFPLVRAVLFPLAFLFFMVPLGEFLLPIMMEHTASFTITALRATGIPVYREGLYFEIPTGRWSVVEACSGLRYLIASVVLGTVYAYISYRSMMRRVVFVLASILVPVLANWLRAYLIVMIGHLSGMKYATGADHLVYGWVFFGIVMGLLFWLGSRWREDTEAPAPAAASAQAPSAAATAAAARELGQAQVLRPEMVGTRVAPWPARPMRTWIALAAALAVLLPWRAMPSILLDAPATGDLDSAVARLPGFIAGPLTWQPHFTDARQFVTGRFEASGSPVTMFVAYYARQRGDSEMIRHGNTLVMSDDPAARIVSNRTATANVDAGSQAVREVELVVEGRRMLAWTWYDVGGMTALDDYRAKAWTVLSALRGRGDRSAVVVLLTPFEDGRPEAARARLEERAKAVLPAIGKLTAGTSARNS